MGELSKQYKGGWGTQTPVPNNSGGPWIANVVGQQDQAKLYYRPYMARARGDCCIGSMVAERA